MTILKKYIVWQNSKSQIVVTNKKILRLERINVGELKNILLIHKLKKNWPMINKKNSICQNKNKILTHNLWPNSTTQIITTKTRIVTKLKNWFGNKTKEICVQKKSICDKTQ